MKRMNSNLNHLWTQIVSGVFTPVLGYLHQRWTHFLSWFHTPLRRRIGIISLVAIMLFTTFVGVYTGIQIFSGKNTAFHGSPNSASGVNLNQGHPSQGKPLPSQPGTGSTKAPSGNNSLNFTPSMKPLVIPLTPGKTMHATSSDGILSVTIPGDAVPSNLQSYTGVGTSSGGVYAAAAPAPTATQVVVTEIAPPSGSTDSGDVVSFGTYMLQLQDSGGHEVVAAALRQPVSLTYHLPKHGAFAPQHTYAVINTGALPSVAMHAKLGAPHVQQTTFDAHGQTVTASVPLGGSSITKDASTGQAVMSKLSAKMPLDSGSSSSTVGWLTNAPQAYFGKADSFHADLQSGGLSTEVPLDIPSGPGGLTPPVHLAYNSASVNASHGLQAAANWVGLGWSLDLGAITWSEANVTSNTLTPTWQDSWSLSDPFGTNATLVPPNTSVATYVSDSGTTFTTTPTTWHTANESHIKVISYQNPTVDATNFPTGTYASQPPCFRVWLTNGIMEEFGCTFDSRQFYPGGASHLNFVSAWKLDLITDPSGNQIHITYNDTYITDPASGVSYPRDIVPATIEWDSSSCHNAQTICTGSAWQPHLRVRFSGSNVVAHPNGSACTAANPDGSRCDDPEAVGISPAPLVESTTVLNDLYVEATPTGNQSAWNALRSYQFRYGQTAWSINSFDAVSGLPEGMAGELLLKQVQEYGTDGTTNYSPDTFSYGSYTQNYLTESMMVNQSATTVSLNRYFSSVQNDHWATTTSAGGSYHLEEVLGMMYTTPQPGTIPLFDCLISGRDHFVSPDILCENQTGVSVLGWVYPPNKPAPQNVSTIPLYRCYITATADHFVSPDPNCENQKVEETLGYFLVPPALEPLVRYYNSAGTGDHWITTGAVSSGYKLESVPGLISPTSQSGLTALNGCLINSKDHMLSDQSGECNNQVPYQRTEGYLPTTATGPYTIPYYRCFIAATSDHFASVDPNCESQKEEYLLGYLAPVPTSECGPSWNVGPNWNVNSCDLWAQTTHSFLIAADNGEGEHEDFTWVEAHNNTHNVPSGSGLNALDPTACNGAEHSVGACITADDGAWSQMVLGSMTSRTKSATNQDLVNTTTYTYNLTNLTSVRCTDCTVGMYWGNENDTDYLDFFNTIFKGFHIAQETLQDGSSVRHTYDSTEGIGVFDAAKVNGQNPTQCQNSYKNSSNQMVACTTSAAWDLTNAASGRETQTDTFDPQGNLLHRTTNTYQTVCPPAGVSASPAVSWYGNWDGHLVAELDSSNPLAVCDVQLQQTTDYTVNGATSAPTSSNVPTATRAYTTYDTYGRVTNEDDTTNSGTPNAMHHGTSYIWNDNISTSGAVPTGTYIIDRVVDQNSISWDNTLSMGCISNFYDGMTSWTVGNVSTLTRGLVTQLEQHTTCGAPATNYTTFSPQLTTSYSYNANGDLVGTTDRDANAGIGGHVGTGANGSCNGTSTCTTYDANYGFLATTSGNAFYQSGSQGYDTSATGGLGLWPTSATDANGQTTSTTYDALGRTLTTKLPGETAAWTTQSAYTNWCPTTGSALACEEEDATQRLDTTTTITARIFYDGLGRPVEHRTPGPNGQDVVQYVLYDNLGNRVFESNPYFVPAYTGAPGAAAFSTPDTSQVGTSTTYDSLGRVLTSKDANSAVTTTSYATVCAPAGTGDSGCFAATTAKDANQHQHLGLSDAWGRSGYAQDFTGTGPYTLYRTTKAQYDLLGDVVSTTYADGSHQATATYDAMQRQTAFSDPDLGNYTFTYDANGNLTSSVDPRGASGTVYLGYDGLNRKIWTSTHSDGSSPLATSTYDSTASGNVGIGRLTSETFASGPSQSVTGGYGYAYDARGQQTGWKMTLGSTNYPFTSGYNDAGQQTTLAYPDGDTVTTNYSAQDWLNGVTEQQGSTSNTLLNSIVYSGSNGASQKPTSATVGNNTYQWSFGYDLDLRLNDTNVKLASNNSVLFDQTRTYDAVGNVVTANTTVPTGTDNQVFCYDEQNRLVWAGSTGTPSCGASLTTGTLNTQQARYTQTYGYDVLNRLTQGPLGAGYTYGDSNHLDAVTSATNYSASYDAAGDMTARNGQVLGYDALKRLISWQNTANNPTQTASYAYDGSGNRVQQVSTASGSTTTTNYIGSFEEISVTGSTTTTTKYYSAGVAKVTNVNGTLSYLVADDLGSVSEALTSSGSVQATQLYSPYGSVRYTSGTMPTTYSFTGQRADPSGLMYYNARYYDESVGQFISADTKQGPNRYGYVAGNPETNTDPTGNIIADQGYDDGFCGVCHHPIGSSSGSNSGGGSPYGCTGSCGGSGGSHGGRRSPIKPECNTSACNGHSSVVKGGKGVEKSIKEEDILGVIPTPPGVGQFDFGNCTTGACKAEVVMQAVVSFYQFVFDVAVVAIVGLIDNLVSLVKSSLKPAGNPIEDVQNALKVARATAILAGLAGAVIQLGAESELAASRIGEISNSPTESLTTDMIYSARNDVVHLNIAFVVLGIIEDIGGGVLLGLTDGGSAETTLALGITGTLTALGSAFGGWNIWNEMNYAATLCSCPRKQS